jgi:hypothetical protein
VFDQRPIVVADIAGCDNLAHEALDTFPSAAEHSPLPPVPSTAIHGGLK